MLYFYNSLHNTKEAFIPITPGKIGMYVCGMTVYDLCHLGHARSMVCFDVIARYLRNQGYELRYVRNITDIDDKIINRARELNVPVNELTDKYITAMHEDERALGILPPDEEPRATTSITEIITLIQTLIDKGIAYSNQGGDVYFEVAGFKDYGKLSNKDPDSLIAGARVEVDQDKHSPLDFVLWKRAKAGEPSWASPWGPGRPGWHIECSAMAIDKLGEHFDIHGGGLDLQFPHHENEIAQSEAATEKPFANYWLHVGMLQINNEKMAKSLGNFYTIRDLLKVHHKEVLRYFLLSSHYRSPLNYSKENLSNTKKALSRLYQSIKSYDFSKTQGLSLDQEYVQAFEKAMSDDFNTPEALAVLFSLNRELNKAENAQLAYTLKHLAGILGLLQDSPQDFLQGSSDKLDTAKIEQLINERLAAKTSKNWQRADEIRQELQQMGVVLEDGPEGTSWKALVQG